MTKRLIPIKPKETNRFYGRDRYVTNGHWVVPARWCALPYGVDANETWGIVYVTKTDHVPEFYRVFGPESAPLDTDNDAWGACFIL